MPAIMERIKALQMYDFMIIFLSALSVVSNLYFNFFSSQNTALLLSVFARTLIVPAFAACLDLSIKYFLLKKPLALPKTAVISGLLVNGIIDQSAPIIVPLVAATIAIVSKRIIRSEKRNIFNPAGFGVFSAVIIFTYILGQKVFGAWWVASTLLAVPLGFYISYRMRRLPLTLSFFIAYAVSLAVFFGTPLSSLVKPLFVSTFFFFASFMLLEPRTSPRTMCGMVLAGTGVGLILSFLPSFAPPLEFTLASLMIINVFKGFLDKKLPDAKPLQN